jgi:hypothetical protein
VAPSSVELVREMLLLLLLRVTSILFVCTSNAVEVGLSFLWVVSIITTAAIINVVAAIIESKEKDGYNYNIEYQRYKERSIYPEYRPFRGEFVVLGEK